jgi:MoxR-like ATPase
MKIKEDNASLESIDALQDALLRHSYISDRGLATSVYLAIKLKRPLFLEGEVGVGKTEVAKVVAQILGADLIRLQCYEGLDVNQAVYEWNYSRQMLHIRLMEARGEKMAEEDLFGPAYLMPRPLLQAINNTRKSPVVLLVDEIDRSDEEFEAYLLELLSDYQISIPEIGTLRAEHPPLVVITSNRTREIHDGLKRRCLYHWIDYPSFDKELQIVRTKVPGAPAELSRQVAAFIQELRQIELFKSPGVAETLDWAQALTEMDQEKLTKETIRDTLGVILKYKDDLEKVSDGSIDDILAHIGLA